MSNQQGDVLIQQGDDGGDISTADGDALWLIMSSGLDSMVYLALFGGNDDSSGATDDPKQWWGNFVEPVKARRYNSETQYLLNTLPAVPANLRRIEDAARRDLAVMKSEKVADAVDVVATIPGLNRVALVITITARGRVTQYRYVENWKAEI